MSSLAFEDYPFEVESFDGKQCRLCSATNAFMDELVDPETGETDYQCNDTSYCLSRLNEGQMPLQNWRLHMQDKPILQVKNLKKQYGNRLRQLRESR